MYLFIILFIIQLQYYVKLTIYLHTTSILGTLPIDVDADEFILI